MLPPAKWYSRVPFTSFTGTILDSHCHGDNGYCLMQQSDVDAVNRVTILEAANRLYDGERWLCPDCAAEIYFRKQELVEAGYIW